MSTSPDTLTPLQIAQHRAAGIYGALSPFDKVYVRAELSKDADKPAEQRRAPFSILHELWDANELLVDYVKWDAPGGPDFTEANAVCEVFNQMFFPPCTS